MRLGDSVKHDLELVGLKKNFGPASVVNDVSLDVRRGEYLCILGPSGCGKTTTLRIIAGLEYPDEGRVVVAGQDVTDLPANRRQVNTVFQHYALFPHLTVADNIAFGLNLKRKPKSEIARSVKEMLELVSLGGYEERWPGQLSGGERQRIALARALVNEPVILLLDEPLGALDKRLRELMQRELKAIQKRTGITFIHVTHDQDEAMTLADRIAVMGSGKVLQLGSPQAVYDRPANRFVASFIGDMNFMDCTIIEMGPGHARATVPGFGEIRADHPGQMAVGTDAVVGIRPEKIHLNAAGRAESNVVEGVVKDIACLGSRFFVSVAAGPRRVPIMVCCPELPPSVSPEQTVALSWSPQETMLFPRGNATAERV